MIKNSQGKIFFGMHFYPGVAEYQEPEKEPYRVFLNEDTIRAMDPTFAGCPVYVDHVDDEPVQPGNLVDREADGYVVRSFYNQADGKHWVEFLIVTERGLRGIRNGYRLSNAYLPTSSADGGLWNGVAYQQEITGGKFKHLAIVRHPRYEESVIMTPEEYKKYNEQKLVELKRLTNSKQEKGNEMKLNFFKRSKVENAIDPEVMIVLPKSGREVSVVTLVNEMDEMEDKKKKNEVMADPSHQVKMHDGAMCNVGELVEKHKAAVEELAAMKKKNEEVDSTELEESSESTDVESAPEMENADPEVTKVDDDEKAIEEAKKKNEADAAAKAADEAKKKAAKEKADRVRNAHLKNADDSKTMKVELSSDMVARGKARYGAK